MKIRQGFVSNSSSTSFCLYGIVAQSREFAKVLLKPHVPVPPKKTPACEHQFNRDAQGIKFCPTCGKETWKIKVVDTYDEYEEVLGAIEELGLETETSSGNGDIYAGALIFSESTDGGGGVDKYNGEDILKDIAKTKKIIAKLFPEKKCDFYGGII